MTLTILRGLATIATVEIDSQTLFVKKLMAEHKIISSFYASVPLDLQLGDHISYDSELFYINRYPEIEKINNSTYKYSVEFESQIYTLYNKLFLYDGLAEFDYTGAPVDFITLIVNQINTIDAGWSVGVVDTLEEKNLTFANVSCRQALSQVAEEFKMEYSIAGKAISLKTTIGTTTANVFQYGRGNGLYKLTRKQVSDQNIVTRVYGFGGSTNIASTYRDRAKKLIFAALALENNISLYGVIEGVFNDESIYPKRTGTISAVNITLDGQGVMIPGLSSYVEDSSMDFDINAYLVPGLTATIIFKSGDLSGYQFEIWKYDHATKRIYFNVFEESDGYVLPNSLNEFAIGDTYTLVNISMPQSYIDAAETALQAATQTYINQNSVPQVTYDLEIDPKYIKSNSISLNTGDLVTIIDTALGINSLIRVMDLEFSLVNPNKIRATISDTVLYTTSERVILATVKNTQNIAKTRRQSIETARRNAAAFKTLRDYLLDADNEFSQDLISAERVQALVAEFGSSAGNFLLIPVPTFLDNYGGDANAFRSPGVTLTHLEISILIAGTPSYEWVIPQATFSTLTPATAYYLYAKCSKTQATGIWVLTSDIIASNQSGFYYFPAGVLLPVDAVTLVRVFITTYGKTYINGREITAGKIQSIDGNTYFDLDNNEIVMGGSSIQDAVDAADSKKRHFTSQPVTPYEVGDTWTDGAIFKVCTTQRLTGAYTAGDWVLATGYDNTKYYIDNTGLNSGTIASFYINAKALSYYESDKYLFLSNEVKTSGVYGRGLTLYDAAAAYATKQIAGVSLGQIRPKDAIDFNSTTEYGFEIIQAYGSGAFKHLVRIGENSALIAGWNFDHEALFIGTKKITDGYAAAGSFTIGSNGSMRSEHFEINAAGYAKFESVDSVFNSASAGVGNLAGSAATTQANVANIARRDKIVLTGTNGECNISCQGVSRNQAFFSTLSDTAGAFVSNFLSDYDAQNVVISSAGATIYFTAKVAGVDFNPLYTTGIANNSGDLDGTVTSPETANQTGQKRINVVTLTGDSGMANVSQSSITRQAVWNATGLTPTAEDFVRLYASAFAGYCVVTSSSNTIIFTANTAGVDIGAASISNTPNFWQGSIRMDANDMWENTINDDTSGYLMINRKGYQGGTTRYRHSLIWNGRNEVLLSCIGGQNVGGSALLGGTVNIWGHLVIPGIQTNAGSLTSGAVYKDSSGFLKIVP